MRDRAGNMLIHEAQGFFVTVVFETMKDITKKDI